MCTCIFSYRRQQPNGLDGSGYLGWGVSFLSQAPLEELGHHPTSVRDETTDPEKGEGPGQVEVLRVLPAEHSRGPERQFGALA